jgi:hypothetical protein
VWQPRIVEMKPLVIQATKMFLKNGSDLPKSIVLVHKPTKALPVQAILPRDEFYTLDLVAKGKKLVASQYVTPAQSLYARVQGWVECAPRNAWRHVGP